MDRPHVGAGTGRPDPHPDDDGALYVLPCSLPDGVVLDPSGPIACDWRNGDVW